MAPIDIEAKQAQGRPSSRPGDGTAAREAGNAQFRAGGRVLSLFSTTLHGLILRSLASGPVRLDDLYASAGEPTQKRLRGSIGNLIGIGALAKRAPDGDPGLLDNELTAFGQELLFVADSLQVWLRGSPGGPLDLESESAKVAIRALVAGWGSTMLRALSVRSLSLVELDSLIGSLGYPALERRVAAMRAAGLLLPASSQADPDLPNAPSDWMREAAAPLLATIRCERTHLAAGTAPLRRIDVETLLLLAVPLLAAGAMPDGECELAIDLPDGPRPGRAGVRVRVEGGDVVSCVAKLQEESGNRPFGSAAVWLDAMVGGRSAGAGDTSGHSRAEALVEELHKRLYGAGATLLGRARARDRVRHGSART